MAVLSVGWALRIKPTNAFALSVVLWLLMGSFVSAQPVVYADAGATGPVHDGSSWCNAYTALQDALAHADASGGTVTEIRVAGGVYKPDQGVNQTPGDRTATFWLLNGVALRGGFAGCGAPDPDQRDIAVYETILSGDLNGDDEPGFLNNDENTFRVVTGSITDATAVLEGFTITAGSSGGMWNFRGSPTLIRCTFTRNSGGSGGGMFNFRGNPRLIECLFIENLVSRGVAMGGAMANVEHSNPTLVDCTFHRNVAHNAGGAIHNEVSSSATLVTTGSNKY